ncbi:hypothetical protein N7519_011649 [Penicillium mononematosum]|uniref:uncharacterized protein n=1 Tax=Penicillium mononematosum TaxID=268346 RepID=UPI0025480286|nr:uncharacterized protein N7519_011649 [Penicillium mononematosum]KAJ6181188.1 hypothetical protein N7519_011649 [Penicillium mononematosum]
MRIQPITEVCCIKIPYFPDYLMEQGWKHLSHLQPSTISTNQATPRLLHDRILIAWAAKQKQESLELPTPRARFLRGVPARVFVLWCRPG